MSIKAVEPQDFSIMEEVVIKGDLKALSPEQRAQYYMTVCQSVGLNPMTKPFEYIILNNKLTLYALKGATDQLRGMHGIGIIDTKTEIIDNLMVVTVIGQDRTGRQDTEIGVLPIDGLRGEAKANAMMKALTKAKRRLTLSMCGLGMLDETEVATIPNATPYPAIAAQQPRSAPQHRVEVIDSDTGEITPAATEWVDPRPLTATVSGTSPQPKQRFASNVPDPNAAIATATIQKLHGYATNEFGWDHNTLSNYCKGYYGVASMTEMTEAQGMETLRRFNATGGMKQDVLDLIEDAAQMAYEREQ